MPAPWRAWHIQLGVFWIATAWLASGLAIAPSLVNVLFVALVVVVLGSHAQRRRRLVVRA